MAVAQPTVMKTMTKMFGLGIGALGLVAAGGYGVRAIKRRRANAKIDAELAEIESFAEPVVVAEEIIIVTEPDPFYAGISIEEPAVQEQHTEPAGGMPGRNSGPR